VLVINDEGTLESTPSAADFGELSSLPDSVVRVVYADGRPAVDVTGQSMTSSDSAPNLGVPPFSVQPTGLPTVTSSLRTYNSYLVETRLIQAVPTVDAFGASSTPPIYLYLQYARPLAQVNRTVDSVKLFLLICVLGGTALAFGAGAIIARRAMRPIADLTAAAREVERTRDANTALPAPVSNDEVAELARTLQGMLTALADARAETEAMLIRQREFVADASHELRTPLTSVLANLELLSEAMPGEDGQSARSALRSSQRMRRLVEDLLLLARSDAGRTRAHGPADLADVLIEAAGELGPLTGTHHLVLDPQPAPLQGTRDDLQRVAINLIENAVRHTPPGTEIRASSATLADGHVQLVVEDDGPGVPDSIAPRLFERFVRGAGDRGGSFGLGLAIVAAVADAHSGTVSLEKSASGGARFVVDLPGDAVPEPDDTGSHELAPRTVPVSSSDA
jgi:signal transduction histidine kinase